MRIIAFIEDEEVIKRSTSTWACGIPIPPPKRENAATKSIEPHIDYSDPQLPPSNNHQFYVGPHYPADCFA
jgi:hypothetical protein